MGRGVGESRRTRHGQLAEEGQNRRRREERWKPRHG